MHDPGEQDVVPSLDGSAEPAESADTAGPADRAAPTVVAAHRWRLAAACAAVVVLGGGVAAAVAAPGNHAPRDPGAVASGGAASSTSAATLPPTVPPTAAATTAPAPTTQPAPTVPPAQLAAEKVALQQTAARLPALRLTSPASWDRWLPAGKAYPGADTADDISTCPTISARLSAALGQKMSYWIGTLPNEGGCVYAPVPLTNDDPGRYPYVFTISYQVAATAEGRHPSFYEHQGAICPDLDVPAVAPGAFLVRCADPGESDVLVLPDQRRPDGFWSISVDVRPNATRPATLAFTALIDAARSAYG